jgi:membrane-associated phospholipid phosphatase
VPEIPAFVLNEIALVLGAFARKLLGQIWRNTANWRLKWALLFVVQVLSDRFGWFRRRLRATGLCGLLWHEKLPPFQGVGIIRRDRPAV